MKKRIRAMVLSAGFGSRMEKAGEKIPKPLVRVCGKPLIHYPLQLLARAGFSEVIINLHHRADEIKKELGESAFGMKINYVFEPEILGTGGGIKNADKNFPAYLWLTLNADTIIDLDIKALISFHQTHHPIATMVLSKAKVGQFNPVFADFEARIRKIGSFPATNISSKDLSAYNYCGAQLLEERLLDYLPDGFSKIIESGYHKALEKNELVLGYISDGIWLTIDTPEAREKAEQELFSCTPVFF